MKRYHVYIMASQKNGTLYLGVTSNLAKRVYQHKHDLIEGFTQRYHVHTLVYSEEYQNINEATVRENRLKKWNRQWKVNLIETQNPEWKDLYETMIS